MTKLICLHHAGGSTSLFQSWAIYAPPGLEVVPISLPTVQNSGRSRLHRSVEELGSVIAADLEQHLELGEDFVLFGKSMGGLCAYLLARHFEERGGMRPKALAVASFGAPHMPWGDFTAERDDDALLAYLHAMGGIPAWLLPHSTWVRPFLDLLRDDARMCAAYRHPPGARPLSVPIRVFAGDSDPLVPREAFLGWQELGEDVEVTFVSGDHYLVSKDIGLLRQAVFGLAMHEGQAACSLPSVN